MKARNVMLVNFGMSLLLSACGIQSSHSNLDAGTPINACEFHHVYTNNPDEVEAYKLANLPSIRPLISSNPRIWSGQTKMVRNFPMLSDTAGWVGNQVILYGPYLKLESGGTWWVEVKYNAVNTKIHWELAMNTGSNTFLKTDSGPGEGTWISPIYPTGAGISDLEVKASPRVAGMGQASVEIKEVKIIQRSPDFLVEGNPDCIR